MWTDTSSWSTHLLERWYATGAFAPEMLIAAVTAAFVGAMVAVARLIGGRELAAVLALSRRTGLATDMYAAAPRRW
ncbi:hypothetical protein [Nocardia africana]